MGKKKGGAKAAGAAQPFSPAISNLASQAPAALCSPFGPDSAAAGRTPHHVREGVSSSSASATSAYSDALLPDDDMEAHFQEASSSALSEALYDEFSWRVRDFSKVSEEYLYSEIFSIGGFKWRLLLYPRGNNNKYKALSVYLCVPDFQNLDPGWSRLAHFTLSVSNQSDPSKSHSCDGSNKFRKREHDWGFQSLMELSKLHEAGSGFVMDDSIVLQARVQVVTHVFMPMSLPYRRELLQRHFKCSLRFYFEEYLEEKVEEWEEFWLDNGTDFVGFWVGLSAAQRKALLQISRDTLLRRIRERLFSEKHVDCNLALDALYLAAEKLRETGFSTTAPLELESPPAPAAGGSAAAVSAASASDAAAASPAAASDPGALSVLVHAGGFVYMTETAEFPALLRDVRRDSLRLVKDSLSAKKAGDSETDEIRMGKLEEIGCRVLHVFAMELVFHECVLSAFREKVARMRQEMLIMEEEEELRREEERKAAKKEKKKKKGMEKSAVVSLQAATASDLVLADAFASQADAVVTNASFDADDEIMEVLPVDAPSKVVAGNAAAKSSKRKGKDSQPAAAVASVTSAPPPQIQNTAPSAGSSGPSASAAANASNDASSDYLSSSSTSSLKHDDAAAMALKQSTFQVLKESVLSKPKNAGKKDNSKAKVAVTPSKQQAAQPADIKVDASPASSKVIRGRSPTAPVISSVETVKLDPLEDPLRLASCAAFLAQPSYAAVFEKKALCFDISNAKCYRWLVPRRSLVLVVDRDAHLLRGVFETTGTVIIDPRKDVASAMSAYVPISPLKSELFLPISLARVGHLINLSALCDESPFELLTSSQFSAILQMLSTPAAPSSPPQSKPVADSKESAFVQTQFSLLKTPSSSMSSGVPRSNGSVRSSALHSSQEAYDATDALHSAGHQRHQMYASSMEPIQQIAAAQPKSQHSATSARLFYQPFASAGETTSGSGSNGFPRFQPSAATAVHGTSAAFNAVASSYAPSQQYGRVQADRQQQQQQQQQQQALYSAGSWDGFSPWGGFDQSIVGSNESPEYLLGLVRQEFQQGAPDSPPRDEGASVLSFPWNGASPGSQYTAAPQSRSRLYGKADARDGQSNAMGLSAGMQSLDIHDNGGLGQAPWMPMEYNLPSGVGVDDFTANSYTSASQQQWQHSDFSNGQRGKAVRKH